ncbi:MAG: 6-phosphogluconate dehydrogenase, NAD-binding [Sphingomonas bacterium]|uniref:NAD(P)-dependent oxidoreductase n=1 Tax=Sphingomonas bacterium TaxID=1895847 RepID=UPI002636ADF3|nr:NAD(P)-dependent oxidoreductase [Sphingomonas bacterium]MDB5705086.1 6-phosphogluconate dehydrogenase, NAD-binding [Sphingomonas bacterium]
MHIGFIGLGLMGSEIAANLIKGGHQVTVWNRSPDKAAPLVAAGATLAATPAEAAAHPVVFSMLADDRALEAVAFGENGILSSGTPTIHVSLSTISVAIADRLTAAHAEAGQTYVSAPVFGRPLAAAAKKLFVVAAGPAEAVATCQPLFDAIGQRSFNLGETPHKANIVKLSGNFLIMTVIESLSEAMTLAGRYGVDKGPLLDVLTGTLFGSLVYEVYGKVLVEEAYEPAGFTLPLGFKDMNLVAEAAVAAGVPMPMLSLGRDRLIATMARERPELDWAAMAKTVEANAGK